MRSVFMHYLLFIMLFLIWWSLEAEVRSLWVPTWNLTDSLQINEVIADAVQNNQTELLVEVRYRADALYFPNKISSRFNNPEPRSNVIRDENFDPLDYVISHAHACGLQVQAWVCALNCTPADPRKTRSNHVFQNHPDWIMTDSSGNRMNGANYMGDFVDPGNPQVKNYLLNVILDIVDNYPALDGIHLDYIRYPSRNLGYNKESVSRYNAEKQNSSISWNDWRKTQITDFISELREQALILNPHLQITAAVIAHIQEAENDYAQDWVQWLRKGLIDRAYPMAYNKIYNNFYNIVSEIGAAISPDSVVIGLRAWQENYPRMDYDVSRVIEKANLCRQMNFCGIALFSYDSIKKTGFFPDLTAALYRWADTEELENSEEKFLTQITSSYNYQQDSAVPQEKQVDHTYQIAMFEDSLKTDHDNKPGTYCDNIFYKDEKFYLSFFFDRSGTWIWDIINENNETVVNHKGQYPGGYYVEVWDGISEKNKDLTPGIYTIRISDNNNLEFSQKKFIIN